MEIYLIRHTSPNIEKGICYGQSNIDLSTDFEKEFEVINKNLQNIEDLFFYSSPLKRCSALAKYLSKSSFISDKRLMEINFGDWELKNWDSINKKDFQLWVDDFVSVSCPNGESFNDLYLRSINFFEELIKKNHKKVAIITHAGVMRSIISYILEIPLKKSVLLKIDYGSILKIRIINQVIEIEFF
ncbi:MAG: alpha-ribazole phosphatase [bacterium]